MEGKGITGRGRLQAARGPGGGEKRIVTDRGRGSVGRDTSHKRRREGKPMSFDVRNHLTVPQPHPVGAPYRSNRGKVGCVAVLGVYRYGVHDGGGAEICEDLIHRQTGGEHVVKEGDPGIGREQQQSVDAEDVVGMSTHG